MLGLCIVQLALNIVISGETMTNAFWPKLSLDDEIGKKSRKARKD